MKSFEGKRAVVTGGGTGMGRELARQLSAEGCAVAMCDVSAENMAETRQLCLKEAPSGTRVTTHECDVSNEGQVNAFREAVVREHETDHVNLVFNNAGIGGGGSFVSGDRAEWERTFGVCWSGVYNCSRAFMPLLVASDDGYIVNTSSVNGFWASLGPGIPHTSYSAAKFAVKGFTEALIADLRMHAPHVKAAVVMPGHIGTSIGINTRRVLGQPDPLDMSPEELGQMRKELERRGMPVGALPDDVLKKEMHQRALDFRDKAPTSAAEAAKIILDGVREGRWRILVGDDAVALDALVRADPEAAYEPDFMSRIQQAGHLRGVVGDGD